MAGGFDKKDYIKKYVVSQIGAPIVAACDPEASAIDESVELASVDYWTALPYVTKKDYLLYVNSGELILNIDQQKSLMIPSELEDCAYCLGIVREDKNNWRIPIAAGQNHFDNQLLGGKVNYYPNNFLTSDPRYTADRLQYAASTEDMFTGDTDISLDVVTNQVKVIYPPVAGQLHLWWGWGFTPCKTIELMQFNHLVMFKKMVALQFVETVLASRTPVSLDADFSIDASDLQSKRDRLQEQVDKELPELTDFVAQW